MISFPLWEIQPIYLSIYLSICLSVCLSIYLSINLWLYSLLLGLSRYFSFLIFYIHVRWVPCPHGMARPQVADGGDGLQIWRVASNILNKQLRTTENGWSSGLGPTTLHRKNISLLRKFIRSLRPGQREMKWREIGENCIMRSFITCIPGQT
jgi:hypothetical protein